MRIWIGGEDEFGQTTLMADALRAAGHQVGGRLLTASAAGSYPSDQEPLPPDRYDHEVQESGGGYEVIHIAGFSGRSSHRELRYAAEAGKVGIVHFWGPDIRDVETAALRSPYARFVMQYGSRDEIAARLQEVKEWAPACIVPDIESVAYIRPFFKRIYVLPYILNGQLQPAETAPTDEPLIVHAPIASHAEGTVFVREALDRLRQSGFRFRAHVAQGLNYEERIRLLRSADIVVDQLLVGAYGATAADAMAMGKPVLSYIRPEQMPDYPESPVVSANPANLQRRLAELLAGAERRRELGNLGAAYAQRIHGPQRIANRLAWIYDREAKMRDGRLPLEEGVVHNLYNAAASEAEYRPEPAISSLRLYPNRMLRRRGGIYVSFNMAEIPTGAVIANAVLQLPVRRKTKQVYIYRILKAWDRQSALRRKRMPRITARSIRRLPVAGRSQQRRLTHWECTPLARSWQQEQLNNHGVYVKQRLPGTPYLDVTIG